MRWLFGKRDRHIRPETMSEYLDGRLSSRNVAGVEGHLATCAHCRDEAESLRQIVALLRRFPQREPVRSFVMLEAPVHARPAFRVPAWAYGAAASALALAFAVILSVDLVGVLAPSAAPAEEILKAADVATPVTAGEEDARAFLEATPEASPPPRFEMAPGAPQVTPTPAPVPKAAEPLQPTPAPPMLGEQGPTSWIWHLAEGLLAALAVAIVGVFLIRRRARSVPR